LLTTSGRRSGLGCVPFRFVGASTHWPAESSASKEQKFVSHPLAATHFAAGATPIWFRTAASSPTIVPIVWVPCEMLSQGAYIGLPQTSSGSHQL
jgi:hypothetical protein